MGAEAGVRDPEGQGTPTGRNPLPIVLECWAGSLACGAWSQRAKAVVTHGPTHLIFRASAEERRVLGIRCSVSTVEQLMDETLVVIPYEDITVFSRVRGN